MSLRRRKLLGVSLAALAASAWTHGSSSLITGATINAVLQAPATLATLVAATPAAGTLALPSGTFSGAGTTASMTVQMTITGAGMGLTVLDCTGITPAQSKALLVAQAPGAIISGMTIKGAAIAAPDGNAAGVRDSGTGDNFTLTNVEITGCQDGILSSSSVTMTGCNIHGNGNGNPGNGLTHEIYITVGATTASLTNQTATCSLLSCHALKSRAPTTTISGGTFTGNSDNGAVGGSVIDIPDGGAVNITGTALVTSGVTNNRFLSYGAESSTNSGTGTTVTLTSVHVTDNTGTGGVFENLTFIPSATLAIGTGCVYDGTRAPTFIGWGTVTGSFTQASPGFSVALGVNNVGGGTLSTPSEFNTTHPIAVGDMPSGHKLVCNGPSGNVVIQEDRSFRPWAQDGSGRGSVISMVLPDTFTSGQTRNYTLTQTAGTPNNTPFITLAQLTSGATLNTIVFPATDFKLKFYQGDLGVTDVFHVSVNDIITNGTAFPWGSNPKQGWEVIKAGPVVCEWRFWGFLKRDSDNAFHRWVRASIWVRVWNTGKYEVACHTSQPNCFGPVTGATVGNASTAVRVSCFVELNNGVTLLKAWGGPSDTRAFTFLPGAVNTTNHTISLTAPQAASYGRAPYGGSSQPYYGVGCVFTTTGTLPTGISANTVYWPAQQATGSVSTAFLLATNRQDAMLANIGNTVTNLISVTGQGTGIHTIVPVASTFQETGWLGLDSTASPIWVGSGSKPPLLPVHDRTYLTRNAKVFSYYDWTSTQYVLQTTPLIHSVGLPAWLTQMGATGDSPGDERINPAGSHSAIMSMYNQTDVGWWQNAKVLAAALPDMQSHFIDETKGQMIVCNNGPDRAGGNYTNLGATVPTFRGPPFPGGGSLTYSAAAVDDPGYFGVDPSDSSHQPAPWIVPYLRSGDDWWLEAGKMEVSGILGVSYTPTRNQTISGTVFGGVINDCTSVQVRAAAWATRTLSALDYFMPNSDPIHSYIKDCMDDNAAFLPVWGAAQSASMRSFGAYGVGGSTGATMPQTMSGYMIGMCGVVYGLEALRGERPGWLSFYNNYLRFSATEPFNTDNGGLASDYWLGIYWWNMFVGSSGVGSTFYSSLAAFLSGNLGSATPSGTGFANGTPTGNAWTPPESFETIVGGSGGWPNDAIFYPSIQRAALASWAAAGGTHAATVLGRVNTRIAALGGVIYSEATVVNGITGAPLGFPDWNILAS